jgi:hypothetical protein
MKCEIIRDLLPSYIEGLTSRASNEEIEKHLELCQECRQFHQEMTGDLPAEEKLSLPDIKEIDYLKKVRRKNWRNVAVAAGIIAVIMLVLVKMFIIGFAVSSEDIALTYQVKDNHLEINLELKNGHDLILPRTHPEFIYDNERQIIGIKQYYKPAWIFNNPFDDVGNKFSLGTELPAQDAEKPSTNMLIIELADKTIKFVNGVIVD